jgi:pimeloyl-ACP methyl ester carboxylesterase
VTIEARPRRVRGTFTRLSVRSGPLEVGIETAGSEGGWPVLLLHGFPYDPHSFEAVAVRLAAVGARVLAPYLRGFGPTGFVSESTPRSGQQAAIGRDVLSLIETLELEAPILVGYDWGGRAACVAAALRPDLVGGVVALGGYSIQDIAGSDEPSPPLEESRDWYQYYFHSKRGQAGLTRFRRDIAAQGVARVVACTTHRGRGLRARRALVRQPRLRRRRHPLLPAPLRTRPRRRGVRGRRALPGRPPDPRPDLTAHGTSTPSGSHTCWTIGESRVGTTSRSTRPRTLPLPCAIYGIS